jgi:transposase-like protein
MRQVTRYPTEIKASVLTKALAPNAPSVVELAKEFNIPYATIYSWVANMLNNKPITQVSGPQRPQDKTAQDKLQAVIDTLGKTEAEQSAYCRQHGIYINHLEEWKKQMLESLGVANTKKHKAEHLLMLNEVKQLKRDLHRKDKALAEVSALLILKKKADLLWGDNEDG